MSSAPSELRYDPQHPPVALLAASDLYAAQTHHAGVAAAAAPTTTDTQTTRVQILPTAGVATPTITFPDGSVLTGSTYILRYLARLASSAGRSLYGATVVESTQCDYFLDLAGLCTNKDTLNKYAQIVNDHLTHRTVLVGEGSITIADLYVWEQFAANPRWANFQKTSTAQFPHLFRWFSLLANYPVIQSALAVKQQLEKKKAETKLARSSEGAGFDVDLPGAEDGKVVTRFPPEPSGYLHIGHAKAAMLNDAIARRYNGKLILRFDDTNPQKEKEEYVDNIMADLKRLGVHHHQLTHTSDYFDLILKYGTQMLTEGKAYIDNTPVLQMREWRMNGVESPNRSAPVAEQLRLWQAMQDGTPEGLACCMRAKIDMQAKNKAMRDPTMYRCNVATPHHRTGTKYKVCGSFCRARAYDEHASRDKMLM